MKIEYRVYIYQKYYLQLEFGECFILFFFLGDIFIQVVDVCVNGRDEESFEINLWVYFRLVVL